MRTFIAVPLSAQCRETLEQMQRPLRSLGADVRWTSVSSIHLTLKFLGEIDPAGVPELASALRTVTVPAFNLRLRGLGAFPNLHSPRVIWCGLEGEIEKLSSLQAGVEATCTGLGFEREARAFHPHLTLGRVNGKRNLQPLLDYIRIGSELESAFIADCLNVYKSVLMPRGAVYTVLERIELKE
jgi:2'-5' RNA ligase